MTESSSLDTIAHVGHVLRRTCERFPNRLALRVHTGEGWWESTWEETYDHVWVVAKALIDAGIKRGDRVAIFSQNRPEWLIVDWALMTVGACLVTVYFTSTEEQLQHILVDSGAKVLFVAGEEEARRAAKIVQNTPNLEKIISFDPVIGEKFVEVQSFQDFERVGEQNDQLDEQVQLRLDSASPDDLNAIIYTSGTTGDPKGVMLSHRAICAQMDALIREIKIDLSDHSLCFLPLAHALERGWSTYIMFHGCLNTFVPDTRKVAELMVAAKPTMMVSVPKLYETVYRAAHEKVSTSKIKKWIFNWSLKAGYRAQKTFRAGKKLGVVGKLKLVIADRLVLHSVRNAVGGKKTVLVCGGSALRVEVEEFFAACGLPILNGYGMTEAAPLISFNSPRAFKVGTVGRVLHGGELKISDSGEVLFRGPNLMEGYFNNPQATKEAIVDGWLHTGEVGELDEDGFLTITDRLKDIIVTLGGKNISPQTIEGILSTDPLFEQTVILGNDRPYLTVLVKPSLVELTELADSLQLEFENLDEMVQSPQIIEGIRSRIQNLTAKLPRQDQIRDFRILPEGFSLENGLLTPSLKVRRREVEKRFKNLIDEMYDRIAELRRQNSKGHSRKSRK